MKSCHKHPLNMVKQTVPVSTWKILQSELVMLGGWHRKGSGL